MRSKNILYTAEMIDFIVKNQYGTKRTALTNLFNDKFKTELSVDNIKSFCNRKGLCNGNTGNFAKGHIPHNKGIPVSAETYKKCAGTMFKKGHNTNMLKVGSERISKDGYVEIKVANPNKWMLKHKYIYESVNGKIPKQHCIIFLDQDKQNCNIENLKLIKRSQLLIMNRNNMFYDTKELNESSSNLADLIVKINKSKTLQKQYL